MTNKSVSVSASSNHVIRVDLLDERLRALVALWRDPEWWKDRGAKMDSHDCADELEAAINGESSS